MPVTLIDGGMGHQLRRLGVVIEGPTGSIERFRNVGRTNLDQPDLVRAAHAAYLDAGAEAVTTNSYACVPSIVGRDSALPCICAAGELAQECARPSGARVLGCVPPLHDSYRPDKVASDEEMDRDYSVICPAVAEVSDLLLCETMSCAREAAAAARAARATGKAVWVSYTLDELPNGCLLSGETITEAVELLLKDGPVGAVLFNCSKPEAVSAGLPLLRAACPPDCEIGAYANGFETVMSPGSREYRDLTPKDYADWVEEWVRGGATIVGGCCGVFPEHIAAVRTRLDELDGKRPRETLAVEPVCSVS